MEKVFQDLSTEEAETEILEHCYVESPRKNEKAKPYLDIPTRDLTVSKKDAGDFQERILSALKSSNRDKSETTLLLGSVGVGKSTFIQRFRKVLAKDEIDENGIWIYFNFKKYSGTGEPLDHFIFSEIEETLNEQYKDLNLEEWGFLKQAYHAEYEKLKRGALAPIFSKDPGEFERRFGEKLEKLISDEKDSHYIKILSTAAKRLGKVIFFAFDNADQLSPEIQNNIFLAAQRLSSKITSFTLLAMREESYWKNRDSGPLNAFHTTAYHVQPATFAQVLSKRFQYARLLLSRENFSLHSEKVTSQEMLEIFGRLTKTILGDDTRYIDFIESTSSRDTRRALENVASFLVSGHTNIDALLRDIRKSTPKNLTIPFHEFLDAAVLRDHESFSENECDILNIFNVSGTSEASNFNRIAVLGRIVKAKNNKSQVGNGYISIDNVIDDCERAGILSETTQDILSIFNSRRLIETETTVKDTVSDSRYVRTTISGEYYLNKLPLIFGYVDMILRETPINNERTFNKMEKIEIEITKLSGEDRKDRLKRVEKRLQLADIFISYIQSEIQKCKFMTFPDLFSDNCLDISDRMRKSFDSERPAIISRAKEIFGG